MTPLNRPMDLASEPQTESDLRQDVHGMDDEEALAALQELLVYQQRQRVETMQGDLDRLERLLTMLEDQVNDDDALIRTLKPVMADAINTSIRDSQEAMIEALYPITGKLVTKALIEAMRDLVRSIDAQMRNAFSFESVKRRLHARASGISDAQITLRAAVPFHVDDLFLIHRESGLLLHFVSRFPVPQSDSDLISGMLTAIRDFVQDVFGQGGEASELDAIHYGGKQILIEAGRYSYIAAVIEGYEPIGFRASLRESLNQIEHDHYKLLRSYDGDASKLSGVESHMRPLLIDPEPQPTITVGEPQGSSWFQAFNRAMFWVGCIAVVLLFAWRLWVMLFTYV